MLFHDFSGQYEFSCPTCGKGFQCKSYLTVHQRVHSSIKPFPCTTCGQNFKTKQSLLDHTNRHLGVKPFICNVCGRAFITKGKWPQIFNTEFNFDLIFVFNSPSFIISLTVINRKLIYIKNLE